MKLNSLIKESRFDNRIVEWGIRHKMITYEEYKKYLKSLSDLSNQGKSVISPSTLKSDTLKKEEKSDEVDSNSKPPRKSV